MQDAVPLRTLEGLPFLLATYERAVLARWALASASPAILAADGENAAAVVLSVLLDALGASEHMWRSRGRRTTSSSSHHPLTHPHTHTYI